MYWPVNEDLILKMYFSFCVGKLKKTGTQHEFLYKQIPVEKFKVKLITSI